MRSALGKLKTRIATGVGSLAAICAATIYTIMGAGEIAPVTQYSASAQIDAGQWQVAVHRAWISNAPVYGVQVAAGQQALVVEADLYNRTAFSTRDYLKVLSPKWPEGLVPPLPDVVLLRDEHGGPLLHPGLRERVAYVWVLPELAVSPGDMSIDVVAKSFKRVDNLYGTPGWFNPKVTGQLKLPLAVGPTPSVEPSTTAPTEHVS